jgi:hypothetical protein
MLLILFVIPRDYSSAGLENGFGGRLPLDAGRFEDAERQTKLGKTVYYKAILYIYLQKRVRHIFYDLTFL